MNTTLRNLLSGHPTHRFCSRAVGIAGSVVGSAVMAAVALLFAHASRTDWLAPSAANLAAMQRCEQGAAPAARRTCAERVVAAARQRHAPQRLAEIDGVGDETRTTN